MAPIDWHSYFTTLMRDSLSPLGLRIDDRVKLGDMPLEADLVIIKVGPQQDWKFHPLWQHLVDTNVLEFKSVSRTLRFGDLEKLLAYTLLYRIKHKMPYEQSLGAWLVIPQITPLLKRSLSYYQIELKAIRSGFWQAELLFPLYVVEYDQLPNQLEYAELKLFLKSGKPIQEILSLVLQSKEEVKIQHVFRTARMIHSHDLEVFIKEMGKTAAQKSLDKTLKELTYELWQEEKQKIEKQARLEAEKARLEAEQARLEAERARLEAENRARNMARQMKADQIPISAIAKYTGISEKEIEAL